MNVWWVLSFSLLQVVLGPAFPGFPQAALGPPPPRAPHTLPTHSSIFRADAPPGDHICEQHSLQFSGPPADLCSYLSEPVSNTPNVTDFKG